MRDDGQRLFNSALPTLIQWGKPDAADPLRLHPRNSLPRSGVTLQCVAATDPAADKLQADSESIGLTGIARLRSGAGFDADQPAAFRGGCGNKILQFGGVDRGEWPGTSAARCRDQIAERIGQCAQFVRR